jgi:predicted aspartyl protease
MKRLLGGEKAVEEIEVKGFENQYKAVVEAVKRAGNGEVKVFKVEIDGRRAEYYVVAVDGEERVVGLKALSVET